MKAQLDAVLARVTSVMDTEVADFNTTVQGLALPPVIVGTGARQ